MRYALRTSRGKTHGVAISNGLAQSRLIAAAPRMLNVLKNYLSWCSFCNDVDPEGQPTKEADYCQSCREARAILRDVEGESNV